MGNNRLIKPFIAALAAFFAVFATSSGAQDQAKPARHYLDEMALMDAQMQFMQKEMELRNMLEQRARTGALPQIVSIIKDNKGAWALIASDQGGPRWVTAGDTLSDLRISQIQRSSVTVIQGGEKFNLPFIKADGREADANARITGALPAPPQIRLAAPDILHQAAAGQPSENEMK